jgi:ribosome-binding protein aMBF1 (putative translation factor)
MITQKRLFRKRFSSWIAGRPTVKKALYERRQAAFAELLKGARRDAGLTQTALAKKLRRPQSYVSKYERGDRRLDVIEFLEIARVIGFDPHDFLRKLVSKL